MTSDEFDRLMAELNKHVERGEVQYHTGRKWLDWGEGALQGKFRIKPTPREVYARRADIDALDKSPIFGAVAVRYEIAAFGIESANNLVKFREVTDE